MSRKREIAEAVVRQFAKGISTLNLELIAPILNEDFKFVYRIGGSNVRIIAHPDIQKQAFP